MQGCPVRRPANHMAAGMGVSLAGVWKRGPGPQVASFPVCSAHKWPGWLAGGLHRAGLLAVSAVCHYPHPLWARTDRYLPACWESEKAHGDD
jgi:hypothetical protein